MRPFQFHLKEHWRYPQSLDSLLPWTEAIAAHLDWWQNPSNVMRGSDLRISISPVPDPKAWDIDTLNINWMGLTAYVYPPTALLHRVIQKIRQCHCLIIVIAPCWPGMPWFWDLVQLSTEIPLQLPVSTTLFKQSHNYVFHSNPQHLNFHAWCVGVDSSKNKASLWRW